MPVCVFVYNLEFCVVVIYEAFCFDVALSQKNGAPNET